MADEQGRRGSASGARFLFINKDASTITTREKDLKLDTAIQSHVQRHMHRRQFLESLSADLHATEKPQSSHDASSIARSLEQSGIASLSLQQGVPMLLHDGTISPPTSVQSEPMGQSEIVNHPRNVSHGLMHAATHPQDTATGRQRAVDSSHSSTHGPFRQQQRDERQNVPVSLHDRSSLVQQCASPLLHYWTTKLLPERFYFDSRCVPLSQTRHARAIQAELQDAMTRPARLHSMLASIAAGMLLREGCITVPGLSLSELKQLPLALKTKAIESIRTGLSRNEISQEVARDVQHLFAAADLSDVCNPSELHSKALIEIISKLGGLESLDEYFIETQINLHWYDALSKLSAPPPDLCFPSPEPTSLTYLAGDKFGTNTLLSQPILERIMSENMCMKLSGLVQDLARVIRLTRLTETSQQYVALHIRWVTLQHLAVGYQLLQFRCDEPEQEAIRMACIYFTALVHSESFDQRCAARSVHQLRSSMQSTLRFSRGLWSRHPGLTLWVATIGTLIAAEVEDQTWFANLVVEVVRGLQLQTFEAYQSTLADFLYDSLLLDRSVQKLWDSVVWERPA